MDLVITRCAGLDVHQATVVATVRVPDEQGGRRIVTETFDTMTADLLALRDWLQAFGVTHVALESTGVYWKPVYYALEDTCTLLLINMHELKRVPGRKTDVKDSEWLAQLLECGLLKSSFVPPPPIRELRDLTRYRVQQVRDRSQEVNRLCKVLEDAGIKLSSVASDVMGASGRAMLTALVEAAMCPGQNESAGKRRSGKTRKGNRYLRATLIQAGLGAMRKKGSALQAQYHRVKRHRGHKRAVVAVGHQILEIAFYLMRDGVTYQEFGADYFDRRHAERAVRRHVRQLEALGFHVTIEKAA